MPSRVQSPRAVAKTEAPSPNRLLPFAALLLATAMLVGGCNTMEGFGEDAEEVGEEIDEEL